MPHHTNNQRNRKRRRGEVANPANTLDGLVAKRADDIGASESLYKRYLTENEAIEAPSDDQELRVSASYHNLHSFSNCYRNRSSIGRSLPESKAVQSRPTHDTS